MKKVEAFIRHEAFEPIRMELLTLGFPSLSIMEVKGSGRQKGITERYRGAELTNYLRPKVKIECVVASGDVQTVVDTILKHARTGSIGDGKVFVLPVDEAYRIRTGESGEETLQAHPGAADRGRAGRVGAPMASPPSQRSPRATARSSSGCGPSTWRWWTPCWAATASAASPSSPPTPPAGTVAIVVPAPRARRSRRPAARATSARCAATSATAPRTARRRCRRGSSPRSRSPRATR